MRFLLKNGIAKINILVLFSAKAGGSIKGYFGEKTVFRGKNSFLQYSGQEID